MSHGRQELTFKIQTFISFASLVIVVCPWNARGAMFSISLTVAPSNGWFLYNFLASYVSRRVCQTFRSYSSLPLCWNGWTNGWRMDWTISMVSAIDNTQHRKYEIHLTSHLLDFRVISNLNTQIASCEAAVKRLWNGFHELCIFGCCVCCLLVIVLFLIFKLLGGKALTVSPSNVLFLNNFQDQVRRISWRRRRTLGKSSRFVPKFSFPFKS